MITMTGCPSASHVELRVGEGLRSARRLRPVFGWIVMLDHGAVDEDVDQLSGYAAPTTSKSWLTKMW
jgi:hypothetical protein